MRKNCPHLWHNQIELAIYMSNQIFQRLVNFTLGISTFHFQMFPIYIELCPFDAVAAQLIYSQKVTIKYAGNTIQPDDPKLPDMLRKKSEIWEHGNSTSQNRNNICITARIFCNQIELTIYMSNQIFQRLCKAEKCKPASKKCAENHQRSAG